MLYLKLFSVSLFTFLILDAIWLGFVARNFYAKYLALYLTENVIWLSAIIFYIIFNIGLLVFVILPSIEKKLIFSTYYLFFVIWNCNVCHI